MPRTRSLAWSELKIGILTIVAIIIAASTIFLLTGSKGFAWQRYTLKTQFPSAAGLKPGSPVRIAGVEYGSVDTVDLVGEKVEVTFQINKSMRDRVTTGSSATLGSVSLLGEAAVDITPSTNGTPIPEGGYVPPGRPAAVLADVTNQASQGIEELSGLIHDVRQGRGTVGKLMTDDQLYSGAPALHDDGRRPGSKHQRWARHARETRQGSQDCGHTPGHARQSRADDGPDQRGTRHDREASQRRHVGDLAVGGDVQPRGTDGQAQSWRGHSREAADRSSAVRSSDRGHDSARRARDAPE